MFVNFLSIDDFRCGEGPHLGNNQYEQMDDEPVIHSYFELDEAEAYFENMSILAKERRVLERVHEGERIKTRLYRLHHKKVNSKKENSRKVNSKKRRCPLVLK